jgi:uncharacterized pyridoxamine 5'-phosphate oxidase family protein
MNKEATPVQEVLAYMREAGVFYLATCQGDQPRVRPFGAAAEFEGRFYMVTSNQKKCYDQMMVNPKVELTAMGKDGSWMRVEAAAVHDGRREARQHMMEENPGLGSLYSIDDGKMEVLYLKGAAATLYSGKGEPKKVHF